MVNQNNTGTDMIRQTSSKMAAMPIHARADLPPVLLWPFTLLQ